MTEIGYGAFHACRIESVFIPEGVVSIGNLAFTGTGVERVSLPSTLKSIGKGAFLRCGELKRIIIPPGVTEIGDYAAGFMWPRETDKIDGFVVCGGIGSEAERYAGRYGFEFEQLFRINSDGELLEYNGDRKHVVLPAGIRSFSRVVFSHVQGKIPWRLT